MVNQPGLADFSLRTTSDELEFISTETVTLVGFLSGGNESLQVHGQNFADFNPSLASRLRADVDGDSDVIYRFADATDDNTYVEISARAGGLNAGSDIDRIFGLISLWGFSGNLTRPTRTTSGALFLRQNFSVNVYRRQIIPIETVTTSTLVEQGGVVSTLTPPDQGVRTAADASIDFIWTIGNRPAVVAGTYTLSFTATTGTAYTVSFSSNDINLATFGTAFEGWFVNAGSYTPALPANLARTTTNVTLTVSSPHTLISIGNANQQSAATGFSVANALTTTGNTLSVGVGNNLTTFHPDRNYSITIDSDIGQFRNGGNRMTFKGSGVVTEALPALFVSLDAITWESTQVGGQAASGGSATTLVELISNTAQLTATDLGITQHGQANSNDHQSQTGVSIVNNPNSYTLTVSSGSSSPTFNQGIVLVLW